MSSIILEVEGKEYRLKLKTIAQMEAEKALGFPLYEAMENADKAHTLPIILTKAITNGGKNFNLFDAGKLVDSMAENGFILDGKEYEELGLDTKAIIIFEILKVSGFFTKDEVLKVQEILNVTNTQTEEKVMSLEDQMNSL